MPLYTLACPQELPMQVREKVAVAVTDIHCHVTDAPPEFVNVIFMHGHKVAGGKRIGVIGNVRGGGNRGEALLEELQETIHKGVAEASGIGREEISVTLVRVNASWVMEGGKILPEPGDEANWLKTKDG